MKKEYVFGILLAVTVIVLFVLHLQLGPNKARLIVRLDKELNYIINELDSAEVFTVSDDDYAYLFNRLKYRAIGNQKGVMELGAVVYYVRDTKNGYALDNAFEPVNNNYHLVITQKSIQINPTGQSRKILFIKKLPGPYYNE